MERISQEWKVEGMTCTNCARTVTKFLERKGMEDVHVNVTTHEVRFSANADVELEAIMKGIGKLGFEIVDDGSRQERPTQTWTLERKLWVCAAFTAPLFLGHILMMLGVHLEWLESPWTQFFLCLPVYVIGFIHFGGSAMNALKVGNTNMDVLIFIGSTAAFVYSLVGLYTMNSDLIFFETAATIITLVLMGNLMEKKAVDQTTNAIEDLRNLQTNEAWVQGKDGHFVKKDIKDIRVGDKVKVNEGDAIPLDGIVIEGEGHLDESMLTGESDWVEKQKGHHVTGASILSSGNLLLQVTATGKDTVLSKIIDLVKNAQADEPEIQRLADQISAIFVPVVLLISILTIVLGHFIFQVPFTQALMNGIAVLVISCPCAMGLATPAAIMVGVGRAAQQGVLIKGSRTLEIFANVNELVLDKTGTITEGMMSLERFEVLSEDESEIQSAIVGLEQHSSHPIAQTIMHAFHDVRPMDFKDVNEVKGVQIQGFAGDDNWAIGSFRLIKHRDVKHDADVYVLKNGVCVAKLSLGDRVRADFDEVVHYFKDQNINLSILSGDREEKVSRIAKETGIGSFRAEVLPEDKHDVIATMNSRHKVAMIGDGINDAAALAKADVGISFSNASDIAIHSSGIVLLNEKPETLVQAHKISRHTLKTIKQNLFWAFAYNIVAIPVAAMGFLNPMLGALFMAFSDVVVIGNSLLLRFRKLD